MIKSVTAIPLNIPLVKSLLLANGSMNSFTTTLLRIENEEGFVGWGEVHGNVCNIVDSWAKSIVSHFSLSELLFSRDQFAAEVIDFGTPMQHEEWRAWSAVEMAALDCLGKLKNLPSSIFLGEGQNLVPKFLRYEYALGREDESCVEEFIDQISSHQSSYTPWIEMKIGRYNVEFDIYCIKRIKERFPEKYISVDANMAFDWSSARNFLDQCGDDIRLLEEPVASVVESSRLGTKYDVAIATHCTNKNVLAALDGISAVVFSVDSVGGMRQCASFAGFVKGLGKYTWLRSYLETSLGFAAMWHVASSLGLKDRPHQSIGHLIRKDFIDGDPLKPEDTLRIEGKLKPGLGVEVDEAKVNSLNQAYEQDGPQRYYDVSTY